MGLIERLGDDLTSLGSITSRAMFGGYGLSWDGIIIGILFRERLYLKVDDHSRGGYLSRAMAPFRPNEHQTIKSYYEVPPDVVADREELISWVKEAIRAAQSE